MGREEEIAYAREHGIPVKGGTEAAPYSIDDNLWGRSSEGRAIEDLDQPPPDDVFQLVTRPEDAPDEPQLLRVGFERGVPGLARRRARSGWSSCSSAPPRSAAGTGSASSTTSRTGSSASRCATSTRCRPRRSSCTAHRELEKLVSTIHQNNFKGALESHWAYLCYAGPLARAAAPRPRRLHGRRPTSYVTGEVTLKLYKGSVTPGRAQLALRALRPLAGLASASRAASSPRTRARGSSSCSRCRAGWRTGFATAEPGRGEELMSDHLRGDRARGGRRSSASATARSFASRRRRGRRRGERARGRRLRGHARRAEDED